MKYIKYNICLKVTSELEIFSSVYLSVSRQYCTKNYLKANIGLFKHFIGQMILLAYQG